MTALLKDGPYLTFEEYLELEEASDIKHEYIDGYVHAMGGARREHNYIGTNILTLLSAQLRGKRCAALGPDMRLKISLPGRTFGYYPDVTVDCSEKQTEDTEEPTVLFEVLSPSTARGDHGDKLINYLSLQSMKVYVLAEQSKPHLTVYRRQRDGAWAREAVTGLDATLQLPEIECTLTMGEIYDRVVFAATAD